MAVSMIGIFWINPDQTLIVDQKNWTELPPCKSDWLNYSDHYQFWEKYSQNYGLDFDYVTYPRGRVMFNPKIQKSKILASKTTLKNKILISKIAEAFNLQRFVVEPDEHYEKATELLALRVDEDLL
jgi:hypothetical protein